MRKSKIMMPNIKLPISFFLAAFNTISIKMSFAYTYDISIRSEISTNPLLIGVRSESFITIENLAYS